MKNYVSASFILLYEKYQSKINASKSSGEKDKIVDTIYHEREFIEWLRIKYKEKLTEESYQILSTSVNFEKYFSDYNKTKDKSIESLKKENIHEQILSEKLIPISKYEYDVDIVEAYFKIKELVDSIDLLQKFNNKEQYLESIQYPIAEYCKNNQLPFKKVLEIKYPIVVDNSVNNFETYLGRTLIAFDINKIEAILSYQNSKWNRVDFFASIVEHGVYNYVKNSSPFDNNLRLSKIMVWVEKNRIFLSEKLANDDIIPEETFKTDIVKEDFSKEGVKKAQRSNLPKEKKLNREKPKKSKYLSKSIKVKGQKDDLSKKRQENIGYIVTEIMPFHYWPHSQEKLDHLYSVLINNTKINKNNLFAESFRKYEDFPKNGTEWISALNQLMFLLYLIYDKKKLFKSITLHSIALKLFKSSNQSFNAKALNTTFNKLVADLDGKKKLSPGLQSIQDIFDHLQNDQK